ncbi:MAG: hypothetical protein GX446_09085 [Chthonomonadales bacterium]|nr:hypothetical protein [Chthonomonadales bacterium]
MDRSFRVVACLACVAMLLGIAAAGYGQDTYTVKRTFKAGEVDRYKTNIQIESDAGMKVEIVFETTEKTVEMKADGAMVRSITVDRAEMLLNGQTMAMPGFQPATITSTFDKDGKPVKEEGQAGQFRQFLSMTRPTSEAQKPLKVGEDWKTEVPTNKDGTKKLDVTVTLVGLEPKSDSLAAESYKIKTVADGVVEGQDGDQKIRVESTSFVRRDNGAPLRIEGTVTGIKAAPLGAAEVSFKVVRQPDKPTAELR